VIGVIQCAGSKRKAAGFLKAKDGTTDQWEAAKAKWSEERSKWAGCQQLATDQKLTGRESWAFLYRCMT
jgi:hypothetical protein